MQGSWLTNRLLPRLRLCTAAGLGLVVTAIVVLTATPSTRDTSDSALFAPLQPAPEAAAQMVPRQQPRLAKAMRAHRCSTDQAITQSGEWSALVIIGGSLRHVDSDQGWAIYTGRRPGRFVALCKGG